MQTKQKKIITRISTIVSVLVFSVAFLSYFFLRSQWLDDWDSVQFVMAMDVLDLQLHQPHPPGYVAYIYLARALDALIQDPAKTLVIMSCLAGSFSIALIFLLGKNLRGMTAGLLAAAILFSAPEFFRMSLIAMADIVVIPFFLGAVLLLLYGHERDGSIGSVAILLGGLLMGWGVGIRPQWVFLFSGVAVSYLILFRSFKKNICLIIGGITGTFAWLVPVSLLQGGFFNYIKSCKGMYDCNPSIRLNYSINDFFALAELLGHRWTIPLAGLLFCAVVSGISYYFIFYSKETITPGRTVAPFSVCLGMSCFLLVIGTAGTLAFHSVRSNRMILPLLPLLAFICAILIDAGLKRIPWKAVHLCLVTIIIGSLVVAMYQSLTLGYLLHNSIPPPIQAARFIQSKYSSDDTVLISQASFRHWQYYLPDYQTVFTGTRQEDFLESMNPEDVLNGYSTVITENPLGSREVSKLNIFQRPHDVYFKHRQTSIYQYDFDELDLFFVSGHYAPEVLWFWVKDRASGWIRSGRESVEDLHLRIRAFRIARQLIININDEEVWSGVIPANDVDLIIPISIPEEWAKITFSTPDGCQRPADLGASVDTRCLSFAVLRCYLGSN